MKLQTFWRRSPSSACFGRFRALHDDRSLRARRSQRGAGFSLWQKSRAEQDYGEIELRAVIRGSRWQLLIRSWQPARQTSAVGRAALVAARPQRSASTAWIGMYTRPV